MPLEGEKRNKGKGPKGKGQGGLEIKKDLCGLVPGKNAANSQPRVHGLQEVEVVRSVNSKPRGIKALAGPGIFQVLPPRGDLG